jgi:hypothetical protein
MNGSSKGEQGVMREKGKNHHLGEWAMISDCN